LTTTSNTIVITLAASITDNRIDSAIVEKVEIKSGDGQVVTPVINPQKADSDQTSTASTCPPLTDVERAKSLDYIYADFKDGSGMHLVSIDDTRLLAYFIPSYKIGTNIKPAMGAKLIRSSRQVRGFRVSGYALVKCDE
jgi:hypothetical protein